MHFIYNRIKNIIVRILTIINKKVSAYGVKINH